MPPASLTSFTPSFTAAGIVLPAETKPPDSAATTPILMTLSSARAPESAAPRAIVSTAAPTPMGFLMPLLLGTDFAGNVILLYDDLHCQSAIPAAGFCQHF